MTPGWLEILFGFAGPRCLCFWNMSPPCIYLMEFPGQCLAAWWIIFFLCFFVVGNLSRWCKTWTAHTVCFSISDSFFRFSEIFFEQISEKISFATIFPRLVFSISYCGKMFDKESNIGFKMNEVSTGGTIQSPYILKPRMSQDVSKWLVNGCKWVIT